MAEYGDADSLHRGDAFDVFDVDGSGVVIVRRADGAERFLQGEDGLQLERELDLFGAVFDDADAYVEHTDGMLSDHFGNV